MIPERHIGHVRHAVVLVELVALNSAVAVHEHEEPARPVGEHARKIDAGVGIDWDHQVVFAVAAQPGEQLGLSDTW